MSDTRNQAGPDEGPVGEVRKAASHLAEEAREMVGSAAEAVQQRAGEVATAARGYAGDIGELLHVLGVGLRRALEQSAKRRPLATILLAGAAGLILGAILRR